MKEVHPHAWRLLNVHNNAPERCIIHGWLQIYFIVVLWVIVRLCLPPPWISWLQTVRHFHIAPAVIQSDRQLSPEGSNQGGVDRVSVIHVHVVPAALGGKVIEAQPEHCIRTGRENIKRSSECIGWIYIACVASWHSYFDTQCIRKPMARFYYVIIFYVFMISFYILL